MKRFFVLGLVFVAGAAMAHDGVKNPAVKARMADMGQIAASTKLLGQMAKGATPFDAASAKIAAENIAKLAGDIEARFKAQEDDPKSEAKPVIWTSFSDFSAKAKGLEVAARDASVSVATLDDLQGALRNIGGACAACHKPYRE